VADRPEDLIDEIDAVLQELDGLPADKFGGRPWNGFPPAEYMDDSDRQRERWQWHFHVLMDKLNWFFRNSTEYRQLEMTTLSQQFEWAMFGTASVTRDLERVKELLETEVNSRPSNAPIDPRRIAERWKEDGWNERLRQARLKRQHGVKEAAKECGVSPETFRKWESGSKTGRPPEQRNVFAALNYVRSVESNCASTAN
jgi:DNA-binding XRE family transcriptional regulator